MNLNSLVAIDVHTHAWKSALQVDDAPTASQEAMGRYFRYAPQHQTVPKDGGDVLQAEDGLRRIHRRPRRSPSSRTRTPTWPFPSHSINPHRGKEGVAQARRLIKDHGVKGFKFHPSVQDFYPNDRMADHAERRAGHRKLSSRPRRLRQIGVGALRLRVRESGLRVESPSPIARIPMPLCLTPHRTGQDP